MSENDPVHKAESRTAPVPVTTTSRDAGGIGMAPTVATTTASTVQTVVPDIFRFQTESVQDLPSSSSTVRAIDRGTCFGFI